MEKLWKDYLEKRAARPAPDYDANAYDELRAPAYQQSFGGTALSVVTLPIPTPPFVVNVHVYRSAIYGGQRGVPAARLNPPAKPWWRSW